MRSVTIPAAVAAALLGSATAAAYETKPWWEQKILPDPFSATLTFTTDYRFRGISQTSNAPGYQGSLDIEHEIFKDVSIYGGVWASNLKFGNPSAPNLEVDLYAGVKGKIGEKFGWNLQFIGYVYANQPAGADLNYWEAIPQISYDFGFAEISGGVALSPDFTNRSGFAAYAFADLKVPIPIERLKDYNIAFIAGFGRQEVQNNGRFGLPDYWTWSAGIGATVYGLNMSVKYVDTDIGKARCGGVNWCNAGVVFTISKTF